MAIAGQTLAAPPLYRDLFGAALPDLPGSAHPFNRRRREASFARFESLGLPGPKAEAWKYTPLAPLAGLPFQLPAPVALSAADVAPFLIADEAATRLVFVNGRFDRTLSDTLSAASGASARRASPVSRARACPVPRPRPGSTRPWQRLPGCRSGCPQRSPSAPPRSPRS
jgi:Fe-S cluster assembly protein SufD